MFHKASKLALSYLAIFCLVLNQLMVPALVFAQDPPAGPLRSEASEAGATPSATVEVTPTPEPSETPAPSVEPTPSPSPVPSLDENITPPATNSAVIDTSTTENESSASLAPPGNAVVLNQVYSAPQNDKVTVTFTKLPENPGQLTIKEVKLSPDEQESIGAFSDTAYDITSTMEDGTFTYDLTLPIPPSAQGQNVEVIAGENVEELDNAETLDEPKTEDNGIIKITGLDHFTVFVLVPPTTTGVTDQAIAVTADAYIKQDAATTNFGTATIMGVYSRTTDMNRRALIKFDLSSIPAGSTVSNATLKLKITNPPDVSRQHDVYRITADWVEGDGGTNNVPVGEVRWDNQPGIASLSTASASTGTTDNTVISWNVTADVNAYLAGTPNYGWLVRDSSEDGINNDDYSVDYASSDTGTDANRPQLEITFDQSDVSGFHHATAQAAVDTSAGDNTGYQTNPTSVFAPDDIYAKDTDSGTATNDTCTGTGNDKHIFSNFDLDSQIPNYSSIDGIEVRQDLLVDSLTNSPFSCVEISWDGGTTWTSVEQKQTLSATAETSYTFGGDSDTWGRTWSKNDVANDFSNDNFRVRVTNGDTNNGSSGRDFSLDWLGVKVYSTPDTEAPSDPSDFGTSHTLGEESLDTNMSVSWADEEALSGATDGDGAGVAGYSVVWDQEEDTLPDTEIDITSDNDTSSSFEATETGDWWFHLRTVDAVGNWTSTAHVGPFVITGNVCIEGGDCFFTIQEAIDAAEEGNTINVGEGVYEESLTIDKPLSLVGDPGDVAVGPGENAPTISSCGKVIRIDASTVTISGFVLDGEECGDLVIRLGTDATGSTISDNEIINGYRGVGLGGGNNGNAASDNVIENNNIHSNDTGVRIDSGDDNIIQNNNIHDNENEGILISSNWDTPSGNEILGNTITGNGENGGIYSDGSLSDLTITDNTITNNSSTGVYLSGGGGEVSGTIEISGNTVSSNNGDGIYASSINTSTFNLLNNTIGSFNDGENEFDGNSGTGVYINDIYNSTVSASDNEIRDNDSDGIYISQVGQQGDVDSASTVNITGNAITNNVQSIANAGVYINNVYESTVNIEDNTEISNNSGKGIYICAEGECKNSTITISGNNIEGNSSEGISLYRLTGSTLTVENNEILSNGDTGLELEYIGINGESEDDPSTASILGNTIGGVDSGNGNYGIYIGETDSESTITIGTVNDGENNTISNNTNAGIYLNSDVTGVSITGNTISGNGSGEDILFTGIVVNNAEGNEAHQNKIFDNVVGIANFDENVGFDARENWWGASSGPEVSDTNPDGEGDGIEGVVSYRPFYTDEALETLSTLEIDPSDLADLVTTGVFSLPDGQSSDSVTVVTVEEELTLTVDEGDGVVNSVFLPVGTTIQRSDGLPLDTSELTADEVDENSLSGLGTGVAVDGALEWGIPNLGLVFSQPITLRIFVGTSLNGQTLNIKRSVDGVTWTDDGIEPPATCVVTGGICTFQATKASTYATTRTVAAATTSSSSSSSSSSSGSDGGDGLGCAVKDCSIHPAIQNLVLGVLSPGPSTGFAPEILGTTSELGNIGIGEVKGEATPSTTEASAPSQPKTGQPPFNIKTVAIIVLVLLLGFGVFKLIIK